MGSWTLLIVITFFVLIFTAIHTIAPDPKRDEPHKFKPVTPHKNVVKFTNFFVDTFFTTPKK